MNERDIFLAAVEIAEPAQRAAWLDQACGSDAGLRAQVEALLESHAQTSQFLEAPAAANMSGFQTIAQTIRTPFSKTGDDPAAERTSGEAEFRKYLQPATRPGWLGRLSHYEIEAILGRGAFGIVAKAFDEKLHRVVAIKLMNPELASTSPPRKRFLREARTAAAVTHENIVAIHGVEEEPIPYLVMEYIPGHTLQQRMDANGPFEIPIILRIGQQTAAGLAAAHAANLIHRDIKPSNILLTAGPNERAKISDFGLARAVDDATMTSSGVIAGTPLYMAPEQARGETLDHRADLFSLGSVMYQMACGRPPFRAANTVAVLKRVCEDTPRPLDDALPGTPGWLETIIFKLLEKKREDRYQTAREVADLLARCQSELQHNGQVTCVAGRSRTSEPQIIGSEKSTVMGPSRKTIVWMVAGVIAVAAVIGLALMSRENLATDPGAASSSVATTSPSPSTSSAPVNPKEAPGWHGWPADAPKPAIAPFDSEQAKKHQEAWASYLNLPIEYTNSIGMKFRLIPPGEFLFGNSEADTKVLVALLASADERTRQRFASEGPQHRVVLSRPFYLTPDEVTQGTFAVVAGRNPAHFAATGAGQDQVRELDTTDFPVDSISWVDAIEFCNELSERERLRPCYGSRRPHVALNGNGYRLPTEAEWEFACRAGTLSSFWPGDSIEDFHASEWTQENSDGRTHLVGERRANPFGLRDMCGNVSEWVEDNWSLNRFLETAGSELIDPVYTRLFVPHRTMRGGNWFVPATLGGRSTAREFYGAEMRTAAFGLRPVLSVEAVRTELEQGETVANSDGVIIRRLTHGYEIVTPRYRARLAPNGVLGGVESAGRTFIRDVHFAGAINGMGWSGPVDTKNDGTTITCQQEQEYRLRYEFDAAGFTVRANLTAAAATRDGIDNKPYYFEFGVSWSNQATRVRRRNPPPELPTEFSLPATQFEPAVDYQVEFEGGQVVDVHSPSSEAAFMWSGGGSREWSHGHLDFEHDNVFRFDFPSQSTSPP